MHTTRAEFYKSLAQVQFLQSSAFTFIFSFKLNLAQFSSNNNMKFLLSVLAALVLLQAAHAYRLYNTAQLQQFEAQQAQRSFQRTPQETQLMTMAKERVQKLKDYNRETIAMLREIQPRPSDTSSQSGELYSIGPMGLPYYVAPDYYLYLDGIDGLLEHAYHILEEA